MGEDFINSCKMPLIYERKVYKLITLHQMLMEAGTAVGPSDKKYAALMRKMVAILSQTWDGGHLFNDRMVERTLFVVRCWVYKS